MRTRSSILCFLSLSLTGFCLTLLGCRHLAIPIALYQYPTHPQAEAAVGRLLSSDPLLAAEARRELEILGEGAMPELAAGMRSANTANRERILDVACAIGSPDTLLADIFNSGSQDESSNLRRSVAFRAGQFSKYAAGVAPVLRDMTNDPVPDVRAAALSSLGSFPRENQLSADRLQVLIADNSLSVSANAISLALERPEPSLQSAARAALPRLLANLKDPQPSTRAAILSAIGHYGVLAVPAIPGVTKVLERDRVPEVRLQAAIALLRINTPSSRKIAVPALRRFAGDPNPRLRSAAQSALEALPDRGRSVRSAR